MGHWVMVIEGAGIHDNGRDDDAEVMLKEFAARLAEHHSVHGVTFTVGSTRELVSKAEYEADEAAAVSLSPAERTRVLEPGEHEWRHRYH
jgi:hypothetical protein